MCSFGELFVSEIHEILKSLLASYDTVIYPCVEKKVGQVIHQSINGFGLIYAGKQFISHIGTEPPLPGYYQYFGGGGGGKYVLLKDTTWLPEWGSNPRLLDPESEVITTRPPRPTVSGLI